MHTGTTIRRDADVLRGSRRSNQHLAEATPFRSLPLESGNHFQNVSHFNLYRTLEVSKNSEMWMNICISLIISLHGRNVNVRIEVRDEAFMPMPNALQRDICK